MCYKTLRQINQVHRSLLSPKSKTILSIICQYGDWNTGKGSRLSNSKLAEMSGYSIRTVERARQELKGLRMILIISKHCMKRRWGEEVMINFAVLHQFVEQSKILYQKDREKKYRHEVIHKNCGRICGKQDEKVESTDKMTVESTDKMTDYTYTDTSINTVGQQQPVEKLGDMEVTQNFNIEDYISPCDINRQPNMDVVKALTILLNGKEDGLVFGKAEEFLFNF